MYDDDVRLKAAMDQDRRRAEQMGATAGTAGFCADDRNVCEKASAEPRIVALYREAHSYEEQAQKKRRAIEILERHPEFDELLELLRIVPIY